MSCNVRSTVDDSWDYMAKFFPYQKKFVLQSTKNEYGKSPIYDLYCKTQILLSRRKGATRNYLWGKYRQFTPAQIRKIIQGVPRGRRRKSWVQIAREEMASAYEAGRRGGMV
jgi:hypothetical protein